MKMVTHQAVVIDAKAKALLIALDQVKEGAAILIVGKDHFAVVPAIHEVVASLFGPLTMAWHARHLPAPSN
jgi:hypothetical protein